MVSILLNCHNGEKYLRETVESVFRQTYTDWELIFYDNCSTDRSREILEKHRDSRVRYFRSPQKLTLGEARAAAYREVSGDLVAVIDADDLWMPEKLARQVPLFENPGVGLATCNTVHFSEKKEKIYYTKLPPTGHVFPDLLRNYRISLETLVFRKATADQLSRAFDPEFSFIADMDLAIRLSGISQLAHHPAILAKWRVHAQSESWSAPETFLHERERWIQKMLSEKPGLEEKYPEEIRIFRQVTTRLRIAHDLDTGRHSEAWEVLRKSSLPWGQRISFLLSLTVPSLWQGYRTWRRREWF